MAHHRLSVVASLASTWVATVGSRVWSARESVNWILIFNCSVVALRPVIIYTRLRPVACVRVLQSTGLVLQSAISVVQKFVLMFQEWHSQVVLQFCWEVRVVEIESKQSGAGGVQFCKVSPRGILMSCRGVRACVLEHPERRMAGLTAESKPRLINRNPINYLISEWLSAFPGH